MTITQNNCLLETRPDRSSTNSLATSDSSHKPSTPPVTVTPQVKLNNGSNTSCKCKRCINTLVQPAHRVASTHKANFSNAGLAKCRTDKVNRHSPPISGPESVQSASKERDNTKFSPAKTAVCVFPFVPRKSRYGDLMLSLAASMVNDLQNPKKKMATSKMKNQRLEYNGDDNTPTSLVNGDCTDTCVLTEKHNGISDNRRPFEYGSYIRCQNLAGKVASDPNHHPGRRRRLAPMNQETPLPPRVVRYSKKPVLLPNQNRTTACNNRVDDLLNVKHSLFSSNNNNNCGTPAPGFKSILVGNNDGKPCKSSQRKGVITSGNRANKTKPPSALIIAPGTTSRYQLPPSSLQNSFPKRSSIEHPTTALIKFKDVVPAPPGDLILGLSSLPGEIEPDHGMTPPNFDRETPPVSPNYYVSQNSRQGSFNSKMTVIDDYGDIDKVSSQPLPHKNCYALKRIQELRILNCALENKISQIEKEKMEEMEIVKKDNVITLKTIKDTYDQDLKSKLDTVQRLQSRHEELKRNHFLVKRLNKRAITLLEKKGKCLLDGKLLLETTLADKDNEIEQLKLDTLTLRGKVEENELQKEFEMTALNESYNQNVDSLNETHAKQIQEINHIVDGLKLNSEKIKKRCQFLKLDNNSLNRHIRSLEQKESEILRDFSSLNDIIESKNNEIRGLRLENMGLQNKIEELLVVKKKLELLNCEIEHQNYILKQKDESEKKLMIEKSKLEREIEFQKVMRKKLTIEKMELSYIIDKSIMNQSYAADDSPTKDTSFDQHDSLPFSTSTIIPPLITNTDFFNFSLPLSSSVKRNCPDSGVPSSLYSPGYYYFPSSNKISQDGGNKNNDLGIKFFPKFSRCLSLPSLLFEPSNTGSLVTGFLRTEGNFSSMLFAKDESIEFRADVGLQLPETNE